MAELLFGGAAAAAGSAALPAWVAGTGFTQLATASAATSGLSTVLGILQGVATAAGVLGTLSAASSNVAEANANAAQADLEAGQSQVATEQNATQMKRELAKVLGENQVAFAAGGVDLTAGVAAEDAANQKKQTGEQLNIDRQQDDMRRALLKARANGYRAQAGSYQTGGLLSSVGQVADLGIDLAKRG